MDNARRMEDVVAKLCIDIWDETPQNHVCGLIEEVMEAAAETHLLTEQEAIAVATAAIKRAWASTMLGDPRVYDEQAHKRRINSELNDVVTMACVVRQTSGSPQLATESFVSSALDKLMVITQKALNHNGLKELMQKLDRKREQGIRL
jgi:hypothetical protein